MDIIDKINAFGKAKAEEEEKERLAKIQKKQQLVLSIHKFQPTIKELLEIKAVCDQNKLPLNDIDTKYKIETNSFISNAISHKFGFIEPSISNFCNTIGYKGGGWNGDDFAVNEDGNIIIGFNHPRFMVLATSFIKDIPLFKENFYNYINLICK